MLTSLSSGETSGATSSLSATKDLFAMIRDVTLILAVYLYYSGYVYVHAFYQQFAIDANVLDLSLDYVLVFGSHAIRRHPLELFVVGEIIVALVLMVRLGRIEVARRASSVTADPARPQQLPGLPADVVFRVLHAAVLISGCIALLELLGVFAKSDARIAAGKYFADDNYGQPVMLVDKQLAPDSYPADLKSANANHHLSLVAESKDWLFLMGPRCPVASNKRGLVKTGSAICVGARDREIFRVAKADVNTEIIITDPRPTPLPTPTPTPGGRQTP